MVKTLMRGGRYRQLTSLTLALLLVAGLPAAAADKAAQLAELRQKISALRESLESDRSEQDRLRRQLATSERRIGRLAIELKTTQQRQRVLEEEMRGLVGKQTRERQGLRDQRVALADEVVASYVMSREGHLKLLLAERDAAEIGRALAYYDYLHRARANRIDAIRDRLQSLDRLEQSLTARDQELQDTLAQQQQAQQGLHSERDTRAQVVAALAKEIGSKETQLTRLIEDEKALQQVIEQIERSLVDIPPEVDVGKPFAKLQGQLSWPVKGPLKTRFGSSRGVGKQRWQGVEIGAGAGAEVQAIAPGRVAFADWLRGFGLLLIIDHGEGYMTLYGQNQSLYQEVGDWVGAREVIASVGASGGAQATALYFEVRHKGQPLNPEKWCR